MRQPSLLLPDFWMFRFTFKRISLYHNQRKEKARADNGAEMQLIKVYEIETLKHYLGERYTSYF